MATVRLSMPKINIECLPSMRQSLKKSQARIEIKEGEYALIEQGCVALQVFMNNDNNNQHDDDYEHDYDDDDEDDDDSKAEQDYVLLSIRDKQYKYKPHEIPREHMYLYWHLHKLVKKLRKKLVKYKIIRKRQLDPHDRVTCFVSLRDSFSVHFTNRTIAYLRSTRDTEITLILGNKSKRSIPFTVNSKDPKTAPKYHDAYDKLRCIVHEFIGCAAIMERNRQETKSQQRRKDIIIEWNADTGSMCEVNSEQQGQGSQGKAQQKYYDEYQQYQQPEGLFKAQYHSETTMSSDFSDNNSEILQPNKTKKRQSRFTGNESQEADSKDMHQQVHERHGMHVNHVNHYTVDSHQSLSAISQASVSIAESIHSEASWRQKQKIQTADIC